MNKNVIIILAGAILTALVVAFSVQAMLSGDEGDGTDAGNLTEILVAAEKLSEGEVIETAKLKWQLWPESAIIRGVYQRSNGIKIEDMEIIGKPVRRDVELGEPVLSTVVLTEAQGNFLAATLQPGMLAYSIPVSASSSVGGFARPGDYVDVILTYDVRVDNRSQDQARSFVRRHASETVLRNIRVMAVDQDAKEADREAKIGKVVTLEVTPEGAEVLALSLEMGDISLALRRLGSNVQEEEGSDFTPTTDVGISKTLQRLNNMSGDMAGAPSPVPMADQEQVIRPQQEYGATTNIRVYSGSKSERITVPLSR